MGFSKKRYICGSAIREDHVTHLRVHPIPGLMEYVMFQVFSNLFCSVGSKIIFSARCSPHLVQWEKQVVYNFNQICPRLDIIVFLLLK